MGRIYFDYNATAPLRPEARAAAVQALDAGNASSVHREGRAARQSIELARAALAAALGTQADLVVFVSGATEAANMALRPQTSSKACDLLLIGGGEHPCVVAGHGFAPEKVEIVALDAQGRLDLEILREKLAEKRALSEQMRPMLALQAVNNETGVIQPVAEAAAMVHAAGGLVVCDVVQAFGRVETNFAATGADLLFLSSHKLGGPKGAGALAFARRELLPKTPLIRGGGQERGFRGGTENPAALAGFGAAVAASLAGRAAESQRLRALRDDLQAGVLEIAPEAAIFGEGAARVANTLAFALPGLAAETLVAAFDVEGVALSSGSACSSGKVAPSTVLASMGVSAGLARSALRISMGWKTDDEEVVRFLQILARVRERMRSRLANSA
ncbi:cysteine desulfurase family protein [uncultured Rhodoblastus sp.]|uniref:cysteine desulfurase family protein n=1 Tax=uncultured Rhodoblastus sp. TaxID=543037 RepID=UPI0025E71C5A|nr:cysteine desulfurase family protein [uncultured Rhodoblastus sp.]